MALQNNLNLILELFGLQGKPTHVYSTDIAKFGSENKNTFAALFAFKRQKHTIIGQ